MNGPRNLIFAVMFVILAAGFSTASDVYFAQSAVGGGAGTSCATAESVATFNSTPQVAGNTYHLCGTVTTAVTLSSSGSSGTPITLLFDAASGGNITMAAIPATGAINMNGQNYWIIDGGIPCGTIPGSPVTSWLTTCATNQTGTGMIRSTNNGTSPTFGNQIASIGIKLGKHDIEIRNLLLLNIYQKIFADGSDLSAGAQSSYGIYGGSTGNNILIHDVMTNFATGGIYVGMGTANNTQVYNTVVRNSKWGILVAEGTGVSTDSSIYGNDVNIGTAWNTDQSNGNPYHTDGIFVFGQNSSNYMNGTYIYNNYAWGSGGVSGYCFTGFVYANQNLANLYIFNNVFNLTAGYACNGMVTTGYGTTSQYIFNNTFVGYTAAACYSSTASACLAMGDAGANAANSTTIENNIVYNLNSNLNFSHSGLSSFVAVDYNNYYGWDTHVIGPWNDGTEYDTLPAWRALSCGIGNCDIHGSSANPNLTATFHLANSSSAAWQNAKNLYSICNGQPNPGLGALCFDAAGTSRPSTGNWDMGAYQDSSSNAPAPPSGLAATVQ